MPGWRSFDYKSSAELISEIGSLGLKLPFEEDVSPLLVPLEVYGKRIKNRIVFQPMEGNDGTENGAPSELTFRKYRRQAAGGAGLIWVESIAVDADSRTCKNMLMLSDETVGEYRRLLDETRSAAPAGAPPFLAAQLTHCGRYARLEDRPPVMAAENPHLPGGDSGRHLLTDAELDAIVRRYVHSAALAKQAGFDAVDVRACHGYLMSELLGAFTREGKYGGSFENRCRIVLDVVDCINAEVGIPMVTRLNAFDAVPRPYGWGTDEDGWPDLSEPIRLVKLLYKRGLRIFNISATVGPFFPHLQRPYDRGGYYPEEHQLIPIAEMHGYAAQIKAACPDALVVASAFSWPRHFGANLAAGGIKAGLYDMAGWGRQIYAYPDFPNDLSQNGKMQERKCCLSCSYCVDLMAAKEKTGCIVRDSEIYLPFFKSLK